MVHSLIVHVYLGIPSHEESNGNTMFWASAMAFAKLLTRHATATSEKGESCASGITGTNETQETSSLQRESSGSDSNLSIREWPSGKYLVTSSYFSEAMCDRVSIDQQRKEEQNVMTFVRDNSPVSEEFLRTGQWIQVTRSGLASPQTVGFWPNSNKTAVGATLLREGRNSN